ncbi:MAG: hypothetical protein ABW007_22600 [Chitinophagaceae bacterium]
MSGVFRIIDRSPGQQQFTLSAQDDNDNGFKEYLERLLKMIPGEMIGIYMIGSGFIPKEYDKLQAVWAALCLILLILIRVWGTKDKEKDLPYQKFPVFVSSIAFLIWVYWMGAPFIPWGIHLPWVGSLAILIWTFIIPYFYSGDPE